MMDSDPDAARGRRRFSPRRSVVLLAALGLFLLFYQLNALLSSSFRISLFGVEILEVERLDERAPAAQVESSAGVPAGPSAAPARLPAEGTRGPSPGVFVVVEQMPELIGGLESILRDLRYPAVARQAGIEGRVIVQFVVDEQGRVNDADVVRGIGAGCDEEALRAVQAARFRPGRQGGKAVKVRMSLPVTFRLD